MPGILIADSGSTKTEWCLVNGKTKKKIITQGMSPYFLSGEQIVALLTKELLPKLKESPSSIFFYGTGCSNPANVKLVSSALHKVFGKKPAIEINHDLTGVARALCGRDKGVACILGTGSNSCYYNGKKIMKNSPGLGYVLGDEGSGAYLGKKVIQYYLYNTFEPDLMDRFRIKYNITAPEILDAVYKKPLPNRYLAGFAVFLSENRGNFMIENILEDGFNDFFFNHLFKYSESWTLPVHFAGSIAYVFRDVIKEMCMTHEIQLGKIMKDPMEGLLLYHSK